MSETTRALIVRHWELANARRWPEFSALLAHDLSYEVPQTQEYIESGHGYFEMFRTWPGDWIVTIKHLVCDDSKAICIIDFAVGESVMTGISIFEVQDGLIHKVTDYWPEPYEPPPRETAHLKRRSSAA
jgi:SnoaL-like domain